MRYRKKPIEVEAWCWESFSFDDESIPQWVKDAVEDGRIYFIRYHSHRGRKSKGTILIDYIRNYPDSFNEMQEVYLEIKTFDGLALANIGDYIVRGFTGELYPCKHNIFEMTYEKVE